MEELDAAFVRFQQLRAEISTLEDSLHSEADVRLKVVDPILCEVLGWPKDCILAEESAGTGFVDYKLSIDGRARLIVEAKKDGRDLGVSADKSGRFFKLNGPVFKTKHIKEGIEQAIRYCGHKSAELAAVTNGRQWVVFRASRLGDGKDTLEGYGCVIGSLEAVESNFELFHSLLSMDSVRGHRFRATFQQAEGAPIQASSFRMQLRSPETRRLLPADKLVNDIDRVMTSFFRTLSDPELRRACFVTSPESDQADVRLSRISEELVHQVQVLETEEGSEIVETIRTIDETQSQAFGLVIGTKGAGKSTFVERFFADILPADLSKKCVVIRIDLANSEGNEQRVADWLNKSLLELAEPTIFDGRPPSFNQLQGMYFDEYRRWSEGPYQHLYESDKSAFKTKFGEYVEQLRKEQPVDYIVRLLTRVVRSGKKIPCLVFDNADHFTIDFQERVFQYAQSIYNRVICLVLVPITDKTSWQLSRQGALQSFFTESFYLPTPSPKAVLLKRIAYLEQLLENQPAEKGTGYLLGRGIPLSIDNLRAFVNCLQEVFVKTGEVSQWIGNLSNNDIRRCLKLTRDAITSPYIPVYKLLQAYVSKSTVEVDSEATKQALIHGKYDIYPEGQHEFVQNVFSLHTEIHTSPLLGLRTLCLLQDVRHEEPDGESRFILVNDVIDYVLQMGFDSNVIRLWLESMLRCALVRSYDPTATSLSDATKIEVSPSGLQHLQWATGDWIYLEAMLEVTPIANRDIFAALQQCGTLQVPSERRRAIGLFVDYLLAEDDKYCVVPAHESFESQLSLTEMFQKQKEGLSASQPITESVRYGRHTGTVVNWDEAKGYGFIRLEGQSLQVFAHCSDVEGQGSLDVGDQVMCDVVDGKEGKQKAIAVAKIAPATE